MAAALWQWASWMHISRRSQPFCPGCWTWIFFLGLGRSARPTKRERYRSCTIVADRLCGAIADPIVRNAQEKRQLAIIEKYLTERGYKLKAHTPGKPLDQMDPGTFAFRLNVKVRNSQSDDKTVNIPVDAVIQPLAATLPHLPIMVEAKSAGDFTNTNKRRKEEAGSSANLKADLRGAPVLCLFLCGYFDAVILAMRRLMELIGYGSIGWKTLTNWGFGMPAIIEAETSRLAEQRWLDRLKTARERNKWGQFATPPACRLI